MAQWKQHSAESDPIDSEAPTIVIWDYADPENPINWSKPRKWMVTLSASTVSGMAAAVSTVIAIGYPSMREELNCSEEQASLTLACFALGFAVAPLFLAPVSEEWGRRPMYLITVGLVTILFLPIALATNVQTVMGSRFLQGAAASTGSTMVGGTIADIWETSDRGFPMSLFSFAVLALCGVGPAISGSFVEQLGWRWVQWIGMCFTGCLTVWLFVLGAPETRGSILVERKAARLRKVTGDSRYQTDVPVLSLRKLIWITLTRPIYLLFTEPIVVAFSLWMGFCWGLVYGLIDSIGLVFESLYGFTPKQVGLAFLSMTVGTLLGALVNVVQERLYRDNFPYRGIEARLYCACGAGLTFSLGGFLYAWTSYPQFPWIAPCIGITVLVASIFTIYQAVYNYLADSYLSYASSALAGQSLCRNLMATAFSLFTPKLYQHLGFRWGSTLIALVGAMLSPIPFVLFFFGPRIRARSKFATGVQQGGIDSAQDPLKVNNAAVM